MTKINSASTTVDSGINIILDIFWEKTYLSNILNDRNGKISDKTLNVLILLEYGIIFMKIAVMVIQNVLLHILLSTIGIYISLVLYEWFE